MKYGARFGSGKMPSPNIELSSPTMSQALSPVWICLPHSYLLPRKPNHAVGLYAQVAQKNGENTLALE